MKRSTLTTLIVLLAGALLLNGCSDDGTSPEEQSEFEGYEDWNRVDYVNAPNPFLGGAHQAADPEYTRRIFTNAAPLREGEYPEGTLVVKETFTHDEAGQRIWAESGGLLGMAKREAGYDPENGDWEYLMLDPATLEVQSSGALEMCISCHVAADGDHGQDYVFDHPYQYEPQASDFDDYEDWHSIDVKQGPDEFLGDAHAGNDENAVRRIYKKQLAADPGEDGWGYPTGTMIMKTVEDAEQQLMVLTGMVKRGEGYDPANGDWEYYMWDGPTGDLVANGKLENCISCHSAANGDGGGADYVFPHSGDPFNN